MTEIPHIGFILAAYGVTAAVLGAMAAAVVLDGRSQRRLLARLDDRRTPPGAGSRPEDPRP